MQKKGTLRRVTGTPARAPRTSRLIAAYAGLGIATAAIAAATISAGSDLRAERPIAGGYDVAGRNRCVGPRLDLRQSGRFVDLGNADGTLAGRLTLEDGRLTGDIECVDGATASLDVLAVAGTLSGRVGAKRFRAELRREPPPPGQQPPRAPRSIAGEYSLSPSSVCLGRRIALEGDAADLTLRAAERRIGTARYEAGRLRGEVACLGGGRKQLVGQAANRRLELRLAGPADGGLALERVVGEKYREAGSRFAAFFLAVAVVMVAARLLGMAAAAVGQPRVMGEVLAGLALGPSVLGAVAPELQAAVFPEDVVPLIGVVAQLGLVFYLFLVGLDLDPRVLAGRTAQVAAISNASVALPMLMGIAVALLAYPLVGPPTEFPAFALFMGVSMSVTAFPVLARILVERRMLRRPVGAVALACAAVDDVTAWLLIALASAVAVAGSAAKAGATVVLAALFCILMMFGVRPLLGRLSTAYDEAGRLSGGWIVLIFAGVLLSAYTTEVIGVALIFGAFLMGLAMPRHAGLTEDVTRRLEDFVVILLLPLFFAFTGLRLDIGLLDRPALWGLAVVLLGVAVVGKLGGATLAARFSGFDWRSSAVIGTLMNTRGLTELIVLNLALEMGVISEALFAVLVIMALVTTWMAGPLLTLLDRRNELGAPVAEELGEGPAGPAAHPGGSIVLAPQGAPALGQLIALGEPLARSLPPRELVVARLVRPPRGADIRGALQTEERLIGDAARELDQACRALAERGVAARPVTFVSPDAGRDLSRLTRNEDVALIIIDGRRPLLGEAVPRGEVATLLREAPCDVAVLVATDRELALGRPGARILVPFGGKEHDWAALELSAWIGASTGAGVTLLGAAGTAQQRGRVSTLLEDAGTLVRHYVGITTDVVVIDPGRERIVDAAASTGLFVLGLSDRWRAEGLGSERSEIAKAAPAPVLFVRRGSRPGALAPRDDVTRFSWSSPDLGKWGA